MWPTSRGSVYERCIILQHLMDTDWMFYHFPFESNPSPTLSSYHSLLSKTIVATSGVGFNATEGCTFQRFGQLRSSECLESGITNLGWTSATGALGVLVLFFEGGYSHWFHHIRWTRSRRKVLLGDCWWLLLNSLEVKSWQLIIVCYMECFSEAKTWFASCRRCDLIQLCVCAGPDLPHSDDERPLDVTKPLDHVDVFEDLPLIFHMA